MLDYTVIETPSKAFNNEERYTVNNYLITCYGLTNHVETESDTLKYADKIKNCRKLNLFTNTIKEN